MRWPVCIVRPTANDFITLTELGRGFHGSVYRVDFHNRDGSEPLSVIVNEVVDADKPSYPNCVALRQPWCEKVLYSRDLFYEVPPLTKDARRDFSGVHVDVIDASASRDLTLVGSSFWICRVPDHLKPFVDAADQMKCVRLDK